MRVNDGTELDKPFFIMEHQMDQLWLLLPLLVVGFCVYLIYFRGN